jgi:hypothetical protein
MDSEVTDDPASSLLVPLGRCPVVEIRGHIRSRSGKTIYIGQDGIEKTINLELGRTAQVGISLNWANRHANLNVYLYKAEEGTDRRRLTEKNLLSSGSAPPAAFVVSKRISSTLLSPGRYVLGISDFECNTCDADHTPVDSPATDYSVRITVGGSEQAEIDAPVVCSQ